MNEPLVPQELLDSIKGKTHDAAATELSTHRTGLSEHRTKLSEHRTDLSENRTKLSEHRSKLSENRTDLSILRSHLSNERTHMSYLRTSLSFMSFGVTLNRFSVYLQENNRLPHGRFGTLRDTENMGLGMLILGLLMLAWSLYRYRVTHNGILKHSYVSSSQVITFSTVFIIALAAASAVWVIVY